MFSRRSITFLTVFSVCYYGNLAFYGLVTAGGWHSDWLERHLDYVGRVRSGLLEATACLARSAGYTPYIAGNRLRIRGRGTIVLSYGCLGFGAGSLYTALVVACTRRRLRNYALLPGGLLLLQTFNVLRLTTLVLCWQRSWMSRHVGHHAIFNTIVYGLLVWLAFRLVSRSKG